MRKIFEILSCSLLVAGTCIGGGILALPLTVGAFGFFPSLVLMFLCCAFMSTTALLYMEASLWMKDSSHMNTLSTNLLSKNWKRICFLIYLFICYASTVAYLSGLNQEFFYYFNYFENLNFSKFSGVYFFSIIYFIILILGSRILQRVNFLFFLGMIAAYFLLVFTGTENIDVLNLERNNWNYSLFFASPMMLTAFSFPGIVPSITQLLKKDTFSIRLSILIGTGIAFLFYSVWLILIFGSVPFEGDFGLGHALNCDVPVTQCLYNLISNPLIILSAQFFSFFALTTSFLGISLSLLDFFSDSFTIKSSWISKKILLSLLVISPSVFLTIWFENVFLESLEISGGIGDAILSGMIPVLMVWKGRYQHNYPANYAVFGGKLLLILIFSLSLSVCIGELMMIFS